ncbi:cellulose biosynthesis protein BcsR [Castellaniella sp.]|uniref:cellulose biosynthesis protein BcsR n=1 Tax=Castellaniella sp. TaxID=1955812 RepID=UPI003C7363FC
MDLDIQVTSDATPYTLSTAGGDDIAALQDYLKPTSFRYRDIATLRAHHEALSRWPLLQEIVQNP